MVTLGLFAFAAGLLAGPTVHDKTYAAIDYVGPKLAARMPRLFGWLGPAPESTAVVPEDSPLASSPAPAAGQPPSPVAAAPIVNPVPAPAPSAEPVAARQHASAPAAAPAQAPRAAHARSAAKSAGAAKVPPAVKTPARKSGKSHDPFDTGDEGAGERSSAPKGKGTAAASPAKPATRPSGSLDSLMSDVMTDGPGRSKKHDKAIDDMLKDVQKSRPAPAPKREAAPALAPLTASEIATAMAGVKTRANACAQRLKQSGIAALKITVGKDGRVTKASVSGKVAKTPLGSCIEKAVRATTFRPNSGLRFDYRIEAH